VDRSDGFFMQALDATILNTAFPLSPKVLTVPR
jgi:hypothetical protein